MLATETRQKGKTDVAIGALAIRIAIKLPISSKQIGLLEI
jgi:hypothetical protein